MPNYATFLTVINTIGFLLASPILHAQYGPATSNGTSASNFVSDEHSTLTNRVNGLSTPSSALELTGKCVCRTAAEQGLNPLFLNPCRSVNLILKDRKGQKVAEVQTNTSGEFKFRTQLGEHYSIDVKSTDYVEEQTTSGSFHGGDIVFLTLRPKANNQVKQVSN